MDPVDWFRGRATGNRCLLVSASTDDSERMKHHEEDVHLHLSDLLLDRRAVYL
jgi:hypothetical protein